MNTTKHYIKYIIALLLFGSNGLVASFIQLNSYEIVFLRTLIGSLFLLMIFLFSKSKCQALRHKKQLTYLLLSGMALGAGWMFLYEGYQQIGVSLSTLAYYLGPVIVMLLAPILFKEKLLKTTVIGIFTALFGMLLVDWNALMHSGLSYGLICGLMAALMYACMVIFSKKVTDITGLENAMWQISASFVIVMLFMFLKQGIYFPMHRESLFPILFLAVVNTGIGCYLYFSSLGHLPVQTVAVCGYLEPFSALVFSSIFLNEHLSFLQILGALCIIGGAAFANKKPQSQPSTDSQLQLAN